MVKKPALNVYTQLLPLAQVLGQQQLALVWTEPKDNNSKRISDACQNHC